MSAHQLDRGKMLVRLLWTIQLLRRGRFTYSQLASQLGCCKKTAKRYVRALEQARVPVVIENDEGTRAKGGRYCDALLHIERSWSL